MIHQDLTIRYSSVRLRETVAWLIPGDDTESWLQELALWNVDLRDLTLRPVPRSKNDASVGGVLVTPPDGTSPQASTRCQEYGRIAERLFLPIHARLEPGVLEAEVATLLGSDLMEYVFHPAAGLVALGRTHLLRVADLLQTPSLMATRWDLARPGDVLVSRLKSVEPQQVLTLSEILQEGQEDIGTMDPMSRHVPQAGRDRRSAEQEGILARLLRSARAAFQRIRHASIAVPSPRRQIDRLLQLLEHDPDEGLRYALPLGESADHRGTAGAGAGGMLMRRNIDFHVNRTSAGGAASTWTVSSDQYQNLRLHYLELANRELRLGRFRRAAYIQAHLLGDWQAAAAALASGKHWQEAAVVYRDRLKLLSSAAECLEKGGLWTEAIVLYEQLKQFEKIGDLYSRFDHREEADLAYRQAVEHCLTMRDYLRAAWLLDSRLQTPKAALLPLADGWPDSSQAGHCLRETFRILATLKEHEETAKRMRRLTSGSLSADHVEKAVTVLAEVARGYPDAAIQHLAADQTRVLAGRLLVSSHRKFSGKLLDAIGKLVPEDRLLQRDRQRFTRFTKAEPRRANSAGGSTLRLSQNWLFELPQEATWSIASSNGEACYFAGYDDQRLCVVRLPWGASLGELEQVQWPIPAGLRGQPILLCPDPRCQARVLIHVVGGRALALATRQYRATDTVPHERPIGPHRDFTLDTCGVDRSPDGLTWVVAGIAETLSLAAYSPDEQLMSACPLPFSCGGSSPARPIPVLAGLTHVILGRGSAPLLFETGRGRGSHPIA